MPRGCAGPALFLIVVVIIAGSLLGIFMGEVTGVGIVP